MERRVLACGAVVQPQNILREIQHFTSSTSPARVATDVGDGFIKSPGNPMGTSALVAELVAAEPGTWFGLKVPPFAVIDSCDIEIIMRKNGHPMVPPLFFSLAVDGLPRDGADTFLTKLREPNDIAKLVVFDTWIRNWDRHHDGESNSENLLYVRASRTKYDLVPIDHSNCFIGAEAEFPEAPVPDHWVTDPAVYGKFPEFDEFLNAQNVKAAIGRLGQLKTEFVDSVVNSVPTEWGLNDAARQSLTRYICDRASYVMDSLPPMLIDEPEIPGLLQ